MDFSSLEEAWVGITETIRKPNAAEPDTHRRAFYMGAIAMMQLMVHASESDTNDRFAKLETEVVNYASKFIEGTLQ
jgi:hypothetical protein